MAHPLRTVSPSGADEFTVETVKRSERAFATLNYNYILIGMNLCRLPSGFVGTKSHAAPRRTMDECLTAADHYNYPVKYESLNLISHYEDRKRVVKEGRGN